MHTHAKFFGGRGACASKQSMISGLEHTSRDEAQVEVLIAVDVLVAALNGQDEVPLVRPALPDAGAVWARHHGDDEGVGLLLGRCALGSVLLGHADEEKLSLLGNLRCRISPGWHHPPQLLPARCHPAVALQLAKHHRTGGTVVLFVRTHKNLAGKRGDFATREGQAVAEGDATQIILLDHKKTMRDVNVNPEAAAARGRRPRCRQHAHEAQSFRTQAGRFPKDGSHVQPTLQCARAFSGDGVSVTLGRRVEMRDSLRGRPSCQPRPPCPS
jgi:hypothetical protein